MAVGLGGKAYTFGGVFDEEDDDEEISGVFYNDLHCLELDKFVWRTGNWFLLICSNECSSVICILL